MLCLRYALCQIGFLKSECGVVMLKSFCRFFFLCMLVVFSVSMPQADAQETEAHVQTGQTLRSPNHTLSRIFFDEDGATIFTADLQLSSLANESANLYGGKVMLMTAGHRQIGAGVHLLPKEISVPKFGKDSKVSFASAGMYLGGEENDRDLTQFWSGIMLGIARITARNTDQGDLSSLRFFTEPEIGLGLKITDSIRIGTSVSGRWVWGDFSRYGDKNFDAWSANITIRIGNYLRTCDRCGI